MKRSGTSSICLTSTNWWNTHRGVRHWGCFCEPYGIANPAHGHTVTPSNIPLQSFLSPSHGGRHSMAATSHRSHRRQRFSLCRCTISQASGAINIFVLLAVRPRLLLLIRPDPDELVEPEIELAPHNLQGNGDAIFLETAKYQHSPGPTTALAGGSGSGNSAAVSRVGSRRKSADV